MEGKKTQGVFTPEQKAIIMKALDDPEKLKAVLEFLKDEGLLPELPDLHFPTC